MLSVMDLYSSSAPFHPNYANFKRAFSHAGGCVAKDSFTSLDTTSGASQVASSYGGGLMLVLNKIPPRKRIALKPCMAASLHVRG